MTSLDPPIHFGALPEVAPGHDETQRPAYSWRERFSVVLVGEKNVIGEELRERQVCREPVLGMDDGESRPGFGAAIAITSRSDTPDQRLS